jgi:hypothetical protein
MVLRAEVVAWVFAERRPDTALGKADALGEETGRSTPEAAGVWVQASGERFARK